jgi:hypothetical protein
MSVYNNTVDHPTPIYIDSSERVSGTDSAFLSAPVLLSAGNTYDSVVVNQVSIPKSWYNVPARFNYFTLIENGTQIPITIPPGNYNRITLALVVGPLMTAASTIGLTYSLSYPNVAIEADTGKFTFSYTPFGLGEIVELFVDDVSMFQQFGINRNETLLFNSPTGTVESTNLINFQIINSIFITSDMCVEQGYLQELHNVGTSQSNAYIYFQQFNFDLTTKRLLTNANNSWQFALIDEFEREIDLNGINWEVSLILYNRTDTHQLQREDLRIKNLEKLIEADMKMSKI